jgi:hypothetical protein
MKRLSRFWGLALTLASVAIGWWLWSQWTKTMPTVGAPRWTSGLMEVAIGLAAGDAKVIAPGCPVYVECHDPVAHVPRLRKIGETLRVDSDQPDAIVVGIMPDEAEALLPFETDITYWEFDPTIGTVISILLSNPRMDQLLDVDLPALWKEVGSEVELEVKKLFSQIDEEARRRLKEEGIDLESSAVRDYLLQLVDDGFQPPPTDAIAKYASHLIRALVSKPLSDDTARTLKKIWEQVGTVRPNGAPATAGVGIKDLFDRYLFLVDERGKKVGFSPEMTEVIRGILYGDASDHAPSHWIVIQPRIARSKSPMGSRVASKRPVAAPAEVAANGDLPSNAE